MTNFIRVEFYEGTKVMDDEQMIYLLEWDGKRITIPNECTGFVIIHKRFEIDGNRSVLNSKERLVGFFTEGSLQPDNESKYHIHDSSTQEILTLGERDHFVKQSELEDRLNASVASIVSINQNAEHVSFCADQYVRQRAKKQNRVVIIE